MADNSIYKPLWDKISFKSTNELTFPTFCNQVPNDLPEFYPTPQRWEKFGFVDKSDNWKNLHKNGIKCGYTPHNNNCEFAYPSLLYPPNFVPGYKGFIEVLTDNINKNVNDIDIYTTSISPFETSKMGCIGLGQIGETPCVDPVISYTDGNETYFLLGFKKAGDKLMRMIMGGGMMDPNLNFYENMEKEISEEALKGKKYPWLMEVIKNAPIIYTGYIISNRSTNNRYQTTIAVSIRLNKEQALSLKLENDPNEDCNDPHWFPASKINTDPSINPTHKVFLNLAKYDKVGYRQFPNPFLGRKQLEKFRSCMNNLTIAPIDSNWTDGTFEEKVIFVAGPTNYDRVNLWLKMNELSKDKCNTNIVLVDPINKEMHEQNRLWLEKLEHYHIDHSNITTVFVLPKECNPNITFDEMRRVIENNKKNVLLFVQEGINIDTFSKIPIDLISKIEWYISDEDIAKYLLNC